MSDGPLRLDAGEVARYRTMAAAASGLRGPRLPNFVRTGRWGDRIRTRFGNLLRYRAQAPSPGLRSGPAPAVGSTLARTASRSAWRRSAKRLSDPLARRSTYSGTRPMFLR